MINCKIRIIKEVEGVYPEYRPKIGQIYDAEYKDGIHSYKKCPPVCIVNIAGKRIIIRKDEFEIVRYEDG